VGLKVYDVMAGKMGLGPSRHLSREETLRALPNIEKEGLKGGIIYHDGQFDDARMLISMAQTCENLGGRVINYMKVIGLQKDKNLVSGVLARDEESGDEYPVRAKVVINATGVFADEILRLDTPGARNMIRPSQGIHLVVDKKFLKGNHAIMVPNTSDGRVMFAVPWYNRVVLGTTDTLINESSLEPQPLEEEIEFVLNTAGEYLSGKPSREDVLSAFAGLRPLAAPESEGKSTKEISRHHKILVSVSGLISVIGGKWTTYRKMAEDAVDYAIMVGQLPERDCLTRDIRIHGYRKEAGDSLDPMSVYGSDLRELKDLSSPGDPWLCESLQISRAQVIWAVRREMARTLEDVLARRTRALFLDARESLSMASEVARIMATELGRDEKWAKGQQKQFSEVSKKYIIS
jgi:glycerol-3-phosphate dehydrogenase